MKAIIPSGLWLTHVNRCIKYIDSNPTLPILENFLFSAYQGTGFLTASNLQEDIQVSFPVGNDQDFAVCLPANMLKKTLSLLPEVPLKLIYEPGSLQARIEWENGHFALAVEKAEDFPEIEAEPLEAEWQTGEWLLDIEKASHFTHTDELRPALTGVTIVGIEGKMNIFATNMSYFFHSVHDLPFEGSKIISHNLLKRFDGWAEAEVCFSHSRLFIKTNSFLVSSRLIDEKPLDFLNVISTEQPQAHFEADTKEHLQVVKRANVFSSYETHQIVLQLESNELHLKSENKDLGTSAKELFYVQMAEGETVIGLNAKFLLNILKHAGDTVIFNRFSDHRPSLIKPIDQENQTFGLMEMIL